MVTTPASIDMVLGFDFGMRYIGVAVGQTITQSANPVTTLTAKDGIPDWDHIADLIAHWRAQCLVVGLPLNMDGSHQAITQAAQRFAQRLAKRFGLPVEMVDERLSSVEAKERLYQTGGYQALKKSNIDSLAATVILQTWFAGR